MCNSETIPVKIVSFVDAPGHETLMATMLSGAAIMDGALLLIAANEPCPQPQTEEHLTALSIIGVKNIIIVQNKIDLVTKEEALKNYDQIKELIKGTIAENAPIIPISAKNKVNINVLIQNIIETIPNPKRDTTKDPLMFVARSFDINKPGTKAKDLVGGVLGGAVKQGIFKIDDEIEIRPGIKVEQYGKTIWKPIFTKIIGLKTGGVSVTEIHPGGLIGLMTELDPYITKSDNLTGNIVGHKNKLPNVWYEFTLETHLLQRIVGAKDKLVVEPIKKMEYIMLNVNSAATVGIITELSKNKIHVKLKVPVCCENDSRITLSRMVGNRWRLIGYGNIIS